ncbi:MAG: asparaginase domain-containing protein, partial [Isosphaeraceae bacterium]
MALKLITTGGTIATLNIQGGARTRPALAGDQIAGLVDHKQDIDVEDVTLSPSWALTAADMMRVAQIAKEAASSGRWTGVIVTHGTSTLEYTAFLAELVNDSEVPIVFTGAMRIASAVDADGPRNLSDAILVAGHTLSRGHRSLVVFAGHVIAARGAWKLRRNQMDAFISVGRQAGSVDGSDLTMPEPPRSQPSFTGELDARVALVKVYPGLSPAFLEAAVAPDSRGLVLEALPG